MSIFTALIVAFLAGFAYFGRRFMGDLYLERPIVLGPLVGLVMGDMGTGLLIGGTLEFIFMGAVDIGGSVPSNYAIGSAIGTAFAISTGSSVEMTLAVAIPAAMLGSFFEMFAKTIGSFFADASEKFAEQGNTKGIAVLMHLGNLAHALSYAIPTFLALAIGTDMVKSLMESIPPWLSLGITLTGKTLPALGFALLLSSLATSKLMPFFFIGFMFTAYTNFGVLGVAVLAILVAMIIQSLRAEEEDEDFAHGAPAARESLLLKSDVKTLYWRSFAIQSAFSFDRMQAIGFTWALTPILEREYKNDKEGLAAALKRHLAFFNTFPWIPGPIFAIVAEMEIKKARGENIDGQAIQGVKSSLMGPIAGLGDSLIHGTLRPVLGGICASLALTGNYAAPFIFFFGANAVHLALRWVTLQKSCEMGERAFGVLASSGFRKFMEGATMTGLMSAGALVGTWLNVRTPIQYKIDNAVVSLQTMLDGVFPKLIPLAITLTVFYFVRKGVKTTYLMLTMIAISMVLGALGILG